MPKTVPPIQNVTDVWELLFTAGFVVHWAAVDRRFRPTRNETALVPDCRQSSWRVT
jgi:hypothetical protein